ncbi:MAG: thioredoxin [Clostridia bacterium]|nr:thioredoxin [Clostridia bacterium]
MIELNDNNFKQELQNRKLVLVDFYATWCGPCGMQAKVLDKIQTSRSLGVDIVKVNVDEAPRLAMEYGIDSIPTLMLFKDNKLVKRIVGYTEENELLKIIEDTQE